MRTKQKIQQEIQSRRSVGDILKGHQARVKLYKFFHDEYVKLEWSTDMNAQNYSEKVTRGDNERSPVEQYHIRKEDLVGFLWELEDMITPVRDCEKEIRESASEGSEVSKLMLYILTCHYYQGQSMASLRSLAQGHYRQLYYSHEKLIEMIKDSFETHKDD